MLWIVTFTKFQFLSKNNLPNHIFKELNPIFFPSIMKVNYKQFQNRVPLPELNLTPTPTIEPSRCRLSQDLTHRRLSKKHIITSLQSDCSIVQYWTTIGSFRTHIIMYNIQGKAPQKKTNVGLGSFGHIRTEHTEGRAFVVKRQHFKRRESELEGWELANKEEIEMALMEVTIAKICSTLKIGPELDLEIGFDFICYSDCTEFHMEFCEPASDQLILKSRAALQENLRVLHQFHIIHKDIKPSNIAFSRRLGKCVFIDFGLSQIVSQSPNEKTLTHWQGTPQFIGPELMSLRNREYPGYANLYQNDLYALYKSFEMCRERLSKSGLQQNFKINLKIHEMYEDKEEYEVFQQYSNSYSTFIQSKQIYELNNYEFLKLMFKYSFFNLRCHNDTRKSWQYVSDNQLSELITCLEKCRSKIVIKNAIQELQFTIQSFNQENNRRFEKLKQKLKRLNELSVFFHHQQSEKSIINKVRVYGFSQQFLKVQSSRKKSNQTVQRITKYIQKKLSLKQKNRQNFQNETYSQKHSFFLLNQKKLNKNYFKYPADFIYFFYKHFNKVKQNPEILTQIKQFLKQLGDTQSQDSILAYYNIKNLLSTSKYDQQIPQFDQLMAKIINLLLNSKTILQTFQIIYTDFINQFRLLNPRIIIKYLNQFLSLIKEKNVNVKYYNILSEIAYSNFTIGYYSQVQKFMLNDFKFSSQQILYFTSNNQDDLERKKYMIIDYSILSQNYKDAFYFIQTALHLMLKKQNTIFRSPQFQYTQNFFRLSLIYELIGMRSISIALIRKAEKQLFEDEVILLSQQALLLELKLRIFVHYRNPIPFDIAYDQLRKIVQTNQFNMADQLVFNLWIFQAQQFLRKDSAIQRSFRSFRMCQIFAHPKWNIKLFVKYVEALIAYKQYQTGRKMVVWMISLKKRCQLSVDYVNLEGCLFKILMASLCYKRAFKVSQKLLSKATQIRNCDAVFADFIIKCAILCYQHRLLNKAIQFCEIGRNLLKSPQKLVEIQIVFSRVQMLKGKYDIAKQLLKKLLLEGRNQKLAVKQVHRQLFSILILKKESNTEAEKHLSLFKQIFHNSDLYSQHFAQSQLNLAKGTPKYLKLSLRDALFAKSVINPLSMTEPAKLELHIGILQHFLKKPGKALIHFQSAAKLAIGWKGFYCPIAGYAFAKIGQTLSEMGHTFFGAVYYRIAYGIFRKLKLKQCSAYRKSATILRSHKSLPFVPLQVPLKRYFANIVPFLKRLTVEQHRQLYSVKCELSEILNGGKSDVQLVKCRLEMAMHLKLIGQYESAADLVGRIDLLLAKSSDKRIQKHMDLFQAVLNFKVN